MKKFILHMGLPKTGTSALQVCLIQNRKKLLKRHILYPAEKNDPSLVNKISSGNGKMVNYFFRKPLWKPKNILFRKKITSWLKSLPEDGSLLFSSEDLVQRCRFDKLKKLESLCNKHVAELECVFYVRSIVGYVYSSYNQAVKRSGYNKSFSDYIRDDLQLPYDTILFLKERGVNVVVRNYNKIKDSIEQDFICDYIGLQDEQISFDKKMINRSLTEEEVEMMLVFNNNEKLKPYCGVISDTLIYNKPELEVSKKIKKDDYDYLEEKYGHLVNELNQTFPGLGLKFTNPVIAIES